MKRRLALAVGLIAIVVLGVVLVFSSKQAPRQEDLTSETSSTVDTQPQSEVAAATSDQTPHSILRVVLPQHGIDAPIITLGVTNGVMQAPSTPQDVGWYNFSKLPGQGSNIVLSGHVDFINYGPAVFWPLRNVKAGDVVQLLLDDQSVASYKVTTISTFNDATAPVQEIIGPTSQETVTLITCAGAFNSVTRQYEQRLIIKAIRS